MSDESLADKASSIIRKIEALMNKAERTDFDGEREALLAKADELILRYQIDQAALFIDNGKHRNETPIIREIMTDNPWEVSKGQLLHTVALRYNCKTLKYGRYMGARLRKVIGFTSDVDLVLILWQSLMIQAMVMMERDWKLYVGYEHGKTWKVNYLDGFIYQVGKRLDEARKVNEKDVESSLLPVLAKKNEIVDQFMDDNFNLRKSQAVTRRYSSAGRNAGQSAANRADIGLSRVKGNSSQLGR